MASGNTELVKRGYEAWNRGDVEGVLSFLDPKIEWRGYTHLPESGTLEGRDEVKAWLERCSELPLPLPLALVRPPSVTPGTVFYRPSWRYHTSDRRRTEMRV